MIDNNHEWAMNSQATPKRSNATTGEITVKPDPYVACSSLEWKLGIHLAEWKASRDLAKRLNKDPVADDAYLQNVKNLLTDFLLSF